jgi:hypothetical protein
MPDHGEQQGFKLRNKRLVWHTDESKKKEKILWHRYAVEAQERKKVSALGPIPLFSKQKNMSKWHFQWRIFKKIVRIVKFTL